MANKPVILSESSPGDINAWCASMRRKPYTAAGKMVKPLLRLNYNKPDRDPVKHVEDAMFYALTGQDRAASPKTRPTPGFSARSTSPSRRSSASFSSGRPRFPSEE